MLIRSEILSHVPHGFSTRHGGVSTGIFATLNFGNPGDLPPESRDPPPNIAANFAAVLRDLAAPDRRIAQVHQVHGAAVRLLRRSTPPKTPHPPQPLDLPDPKADALVTDDPSILLCIRVADCAPVLIATEDGALVAAIHAGWRGVIADVVGHTIDVIRTISSAPLAAAVGPCIGPQRFEVGPEVLDEFDRAFPHHPDPDHASGAPPSTIIARREPGGKGYIDLASALAVQLRRRRVRHIDLLRRCTASDPELFFSHRRDQGRTGRMIGIIGPRDETA